MRFGTTIAAMVLVGSLTSSTAELSGLSGTPATPAPPAIGPPAAAADPIAGAVTSAVASPVASAVASPAASTASTADAPGGTRQNRTAATPAVRGTTGGPSWSMNLSAGDGAGVKMVSGAIRLDPSGVFLAPLENADAGGAAGTASTGADPGAGTPVPTGLLTLPIKRLLRPTLRVDSMVIGLVPAGSTATVDVRGRDADGNWSEWIPTGGTGSTVMLPRPAVEVQGRLVLTGPPVDLTAGLDGPAVRGVTMTAHPPAAAPSPITGPSPSSSPTSGRTAGDAATTPGSSTTPPTPTPTTGPSAAARPTTTTEASEDDEDEDEDEEENEDSESSTAKATPTTTPKTTAPTTSKTTAKTTPISTPSAKPRAADAPLQYRVFATREGLVGRTTANGHKIKSSDRFVALPSRRALSPKGSNDYSVKVCAANGRCAVAPVWDVGPWNTRDDYWNPKSRRQEWRDLPQGMPEAQAAKERGYNGGKDQFGRKVANPAGIDLSDGLFWGALGLKDNSWVTVEYLWTGAGKEGSTSTE